VGWIPDDAVDDPGFDLSTWFGRDAPLVVEIGSGVGEATVALAATRAGVRRLGIEGVGTRVVADTFHRMQRAGVSNVRMISVDAVWSMEHLLAPGSVSELWTFFPDPWRKQRHAQRRLVREDFAALAASRLTPGGWVAAGDRLAGVRRADGCCARRRAAAVRWGGRALGGPVR
jgi:tRNA (guanine-N7-)-methyltransferase